MSALNFPFVPLTCTEERATFERETPTHTVRVVENNFPLAVLANYHGGEREAYARLFAASPDLLAAAQAAWNCIGELPPTQARVETAQMLQAAIEKTTGGAA